MSDTLFIAVEMTAFFGGLLAFIGWQYWDLHRRAKARAEAAAQAAREGT